MKDKTEQSVSVGFDIVRWHPEDDVYVIDEVRLTEVSSVNYPADPHCRVLGKSWWQRNRRYVLAAVATILVILAALYLVSDITFQFLGVE